MKGDCLTLFGKSKLKLNLNQTQHTKHQAESPKPISSVSMLLKHEMDVQRHSDGKIPHGDGREGVGIGLIAPALLHQQSLDLGKGGDGGGVVRPRSQSVVDGRVKGGMYGM